MNDQKIPAILIAVLLMGMVSAPASLAESNREKTMIKSDGSDICSVSVKQDVWTPLFAH